MGGFEKSESCSRQIFCFSCSQVQRDESAESRAPVRILRLSLLLSERCTPVLFREMTLLSLWHGSRVRHVIGGTVQENTLR